MPNHQEQALAHLRRDPIMRKIIARVGDCTIQPRRDYFAALCKSIYSQQVSTKIATILFGRFCEAFPRKKPTPKLVAELLRLENDERVKRCGLSRQKKAYLIDLADHFASGKIATRKLARMSDEEVIEALTKVTGVGRWTAEMFLIFVLNRPDVWPVDDLGVQEAVKKALKLPARPKPKELMPLGDRWRPHRSTAAWYMWRSLSLPTKPKAKPKSGTISSTKSKPKRTKR
jgi:DNA-3-methyladenine glycosylase II